MIVKRQMLCSNHKTHMRYLQTSWWLLGIIPLYIKNELLSKV